MFFLENEMLLEGQKSYRNRGKDMTRTQQQENIPQKAQIVTSLWQINNVETYENWSNFFFPAAYNCNKLRTELVRSC